jgi:hypothetical protein
VVNQEQIHYRQVVNQEQIHHRQMVNQEQIHHRQMVNQEQIRRAPCEKPAQRPSESESGRGDFSRTGAFE